MRRQKRYPLPIPTFCEPISLKEKSAAWTARATAAFEEFAAGPSFGEPILTQSWTHCSVGWVQCYWRGGESPSSLVPGNFMSHYEVVEAFNVDIVGTMELPAADKGESTQKPLVGVTAIGYCMESTPGIGASRTALCTFRNRNSL